MSSTTIDPAGSGRNTTTTTNDKITVATTLKSADETETYGNVTTTIQTTGSGATKVVRVSTSDSGYPPDETGAVTNLTDFALDMAAHWVAVKDALATLVFS